jgi:hypothetical protein
MQEKTTERGIAFIAGTYLLWTFIASFLMAYQVPSWPQTTGRIVQSYVKDHKIYQETFIEYEYVVNGKEYRSHRLGSDIADHLEPFQSDAQEIIKKYRLSTNVPVFFNPKKPQLATLNLTFGRNSLEEILHFFTLCFAVLLLAFAFGWARGWAWYDNSEDRGQRQVGIDLMWLRFRRKK